MKYCSGARRAAKKYLANWAFNKRRAREEQVFKEYRQGSKLKFFPQISSGKERPRGRRGVRIKFFYYSGDKSEPAHPQPRKQVIPFYVHVYKLWNLHGNNFFIRSPPSSFRPVSAALYRCSKHLHARYCSRNCLHHPASAFSGNLWMKTRAPR